GKIITFSGIEQGTLQCGGGDDTIDVTAASVPWRIFANAGNDGVTVESSTVPITVSTGSEHAVIFGQPQGDGLTVGTFTTPPATVVIAQDDTVVGLSVVATAVR